jgi:uncharacterized protein (TIGR00369 family)
MTDRTRTYGWSAAGPILAAARSMDGLAFLRAMADGRVDRPSIQETLAFRLVEVEAGRAVFRGRAEEWMLNPLGGVHGAIYGALLDSAMGCAVHSTLPQGWAYTTLEYRVNMVRALGPAAGDAACEGTVLHRGGRTATAEGRLVGEDGKLYAHGVTTCLLMPPDAG